LSEFGFWVRFVLAALATWRVTHLLASEDGPADLIVRFRALFGQSVAGKIMDCFNCLSLWVAAPMALLITQKPVDLLLSWLALSGAACLLERMGYDPVVIHPATQEMEGDASDGMLRSEESNAQQPSSANQNPYTGHHS
jgi:hypothetical protein